MRAPLYRVVGLEINTEPKGISWRAWIVVGGKNTPVKGHVAVIGDLDAQLKDHVREVYNRVTGLVLPEDAL
jgi:hypothetical protein